MVQDVVHAGFLRELVGFVALDQVCMKLLLAVDGSGSISYYFRCVFVFMMREAFAARRF